MVFPFLPPIFLSLRKFSEEQQLGIGEVGLRSVEK